MLLSNEALGIHSAGDAFWNDLEDVTRPKPAYGVTSDGRVCRIDPPDAPTDPLREWPVRHPVPRSKWRTCYVYELIREGTVSFRHRWLPRGRGGRPRGITTLEEKEQAWQLLEEQYHLIELRAAEIGTHLLVLCIPDYNVVNPEAVVATVKPLNYDVEERIEQICQRQGIDFVSALPAMRDAFFSKGGVAGARRNPLYFPIDRHCTPEGNRVLSKVLSERLASLLPKL